jgi:hypothetical protein
MPRGKSALFGCHFAVAPVPIGRYLKGDRMEYPIVR